MKFQENHLGIKAAMVKTMTRYDYLSLLSRVPLRSLKLLTLFIALVLKFKASGVSSLPYILTFSFKEDK